VLTADRAGAHPYLRRRPSGSVLLFLELHTQKQTLPVRLFLETPDDYLAFLGRICPEKGVDRAIEIADNTGRKLKIAAKVDPADQEYFSGEIEPLLDRPFIEFVGEIGEDEKANSLVRLLRAPVPDRMAMVNCVVLGRTSLNHSVNTVISVRAFSFFTFVLLCNAKSIRLLQPFLVPLPLPPTLAEFKQRGVRSKVSFELGARRSSRTS
jgi:hypothetical protein